MSEKRFRITTNPMSQSVAFDEKEKKHYIGIELEDLLNEKESIISALKEENEQLKEENEELKRKLEYCEHEHFLDSLSGSNKWFGMGGF